MLRGLGCPIMALAVAFYGDDVSYAAAQHSSDIQLLEQREYVHNDPNVGLTITSEGATVGDARVRFVVKEFRPSTESTMSARYVLWELGQSGEVLHKYPFCESTVRARILPPPESFPMLAMGNGEVYTLCKPTLNELEIVKLAPDGRIVFRTPMRKGRFDSANVSDIFIGPEGNPLFLGSFDAGPPTIFTLDIEGKVDGRWTYQFPIPSVPSVGLQWDETHSMICGVSFEYGADPIDFWVLKIDKEGHEKGRATFHEPLGEPLPGAYCLARWGPQRLAMLYARLTPGKTVNWRVKLLDHELNETADWLVHEGGQARGGGSMLVTPKGLLVSVPTKVLYRGLLLLNETGEVQSTSEFKVALPYTVVAAINESILSVSLSPERNDANQRPLEVRRFTLTTRPAD